MEIKKCKEIIKFGEEVILQVLAKANEKIDELKKNDEISAIEIIEKDVISKYEVLYKGLKEALKEEKLEDIEKINNIKKYIYQIMEENNFTKDYIEKKIKLRKELKGNSGAEVVKNLFEYEKKNLLNIKYELLDKANLLLDEEEKMSLELKNAIQEEEQIEWIYKLQPVREKIREIEAKLISLQEKIDIVEKKLASQWKYEIYGTISKEHLKETFKKTMKK